MYDDKNIANILRTIGHPVRLRILRFLLKGPSCATLTNQNINISQPNLSQHLKALTETEILDFCKLGTKRCFYIVRPDFIKKMLELFDNDEERVTLKKDDLRNNYAAK
jgi:DNA-binding transcriptional ArsR family regulator